MESLRNHRVEVVRKFWAFIYLLVDFCNIRGRKNKSCRWWTLLQLYFEIKIILGYFIYVRA